MDTNISQHMTPNRKWFESYESSSDSVLMGNSNLYKVVGVDTIIIKFHDGKIQRLTGVRHIPDLSKNLSEVIRVFKGCKFQSESGVIRVFKGALTIMKRKKVETLYFLQGSTVIGSTAIVNSGPISDDVIKLWHMSERGMTILSKRGLLCGQCTSSLEFVNIVYLASKRG
jgi:hypothetical protein